MDAIEVIQEKEKLIGDLEKVNKELLVATTNYKRIQTQLWLETDFEEKIGKKRPTVDEKKAYVSLHSLNHREQRDIMVYDKEIILARIRLCEDKLGILNE